MKKNKKMDKIKSIFENDDTNDEESYFSLIFGNRIFDNCFDFGFTEEKYLKFLRFIKNNDKWELVSKKNIKVFYYFDLKLYAQENGNLTLEKDILLKYYDFLDKDNEGVRFMKYKKITNMDLNIFPGLDKINDIRKMREIIFKKDNVFIKFLVVNHMNKEITFESIIYTKFREDLTRELPKIFDFFKLKNLTNYDVVEMETVDNLSLSVL